MKKILFLAVVLFMTLPLFAQIDGKIEGNTVIYGKALLSTDSLWTIDLGYTNGIVTVTVVDTGTVDTVKCYIGTTKYTNYTRVVDSTYFTTVPAFMKWQNWSTLDTIMARTGISKYILQSSATEQIKFDLLSGGNSGAGTTIIIVESEK